MNVAYDLKTGAVRGQVVALLPPTTLKRSLPADVNAIVLLTSGGYVEVSASDVRIEVLP